MELGGIEMSAQGGEIREGFLCPMCMKDLGTVSQLQSHFEEAHSTEDKATLNQLRGNIQIKLERKLLRQHMSYMFVRLRHATSHFNC